MQQFVKYAARAAISWRAFIACALSLCLGAAAVAKESASDSIRQAVTSLYEARAQQPLWFIEQHPNPAAQALLEELRNAETRGLQSQDYDGARLQALLTALQSQPPADAAAVQALDFLLSLAVARFASDLQFGRVDPRDLGYDLNLTHVNRDVGSVLMSLSLSSNVSATLDSLEPPFRHYRLLKEALAHYRALAKEQGAMRSPVLDEQIQKIELTLERVRWLPAKLSSPPIFVNIPQFKLFAFRTTDDFAQDILQMDVIVGAAFDQRETPVFAADLRYIVIRPYWDVPMSIMRKEYLKLMRANPRWVDVNGYEIVQGQTDNAIIQPATPENIELLAKGVFRLRQKPGPNNALGIVKFMLPNPHNVYLHDTPAQSLFKKSRRAFSHGCIRVANPVGLLAHVLRNDPAWPSERIEAALHSEQTQRIPLKQPIPVFIIYGTAMATEAGPTLFFEDIYHHDARLQAALSARTLQLASLRP